MNGVSLRQLTQPIIGDEEIRAAFVATAYKTATAVKVLIVVFSVGIVIQPFDGPITTSVLAGISTLVALRLQPTFSVVAAADSFIVMRNRGFFAVRPTKLVWRFPPDGAMEALSSWGWNRQIKIAGIRYYVARKFDDELRRISSYSVPYL